MSRQFTVAEAALRECPFKTTQRRFKEGPRCSGPNCMCWVWTTNPKLEAEVVLAFTDESEQSASSVPTTSDFELPAGAGVWEPHGEPEFMELSRTWAQRFYRTSDPERRGRCGVVAGEILSCPR